MLTVVQNFEGETCRAAAIYLLSRKILPKVLTVDIRRFSYREGHWVSRVVVDGDKVVVMTRTGVSEESLETEEWAAEKNLNFPMACAWIVEFVRLCAKGGKFEISFEEILSNVYDMV